MTPDPVSPAVARILATERARFVGFLEKRVGSRAAAEEILQDSLLKAIEKAGGIRDEERAVAWFYRVLRNAVSDWRAARGAERAREGGDAAELADDLAAEAERELCQCVLSLAATLKPEYAEALRLVDVEELPIAELAASAGVTANNARVRLHRAREALRRSVELTCRTCAEHGCVDCTCRGEH